MANGYSWELIFIDDGSTDATPQKLAALAARDERVRVVTFRRNFGKAAPPAGASLTHAP